MRRMCHVMQVHPSGYYAWKATPQSPRALDNLRLLGLLKQAWLERGGVYGYRKLTLDMRDLGERCGKRRVARLLKEEGLRSQTGYGRRPGTRGGKPVVVAPNHLQRRFKVGRAQPILGHRHHLHPNPRRLALPGSRGRPVLQAGGGLVDRQSYRTSLVLDAVLMALWRRQPQAPAIVHSDQGCQFTSHEWQAFLRDHNLISSMSRRGNCHDNAVAESFFQLLKRERIRRRIYTTHSDARADVFNYIEMFYNSHRRHSSADDLSPIEFEQRHFQRLKSV